MKYIKTSILLIVSLFSLTIIAQKGKIRSAIKDYENLSFVKTSEILESVAESGYKSKELFEKLGDAYYFNNDMKNAAKWYGELAAFAPDLESEYCWRYSQALKGIENYAESDKWMQKFKESNPADLRSKAFSSRPDYLENIKEISNDNLNIYNLDINSELSDFGSVQYQNEFIFASNRGGGDLYKWNEQPYLDLYSATKQGDGSFGNVKKLPESVNTKYHESSASFTPDDRFMFFTRNNYFNKKYKKDDQNLNRLKIYRASKDDYGQWDKIESVHFNSDDYSVAHPSINVHGTLMYFASDMPGTIGNSDIYVVSINKDGTLGTPVNLGGKINTQGRESFPFINEKGDLFFSSDGYPGLGGLDVYVVRNFEQKYLKHSYNYVVENVAKPINSPQDDFGYYENLGTKEGFFSSNRPGGKGSDDIYSFVAKDCSQIVNGLTLDKVTKDIISLADVTLFDENGNKLAATVSNSKGMFSFTELECETNYIVRVTKENYLGDEKQFATPLNKQNLNLEWFLQKDQQEINIGDDLAKILNIPIIYFDLDKYNIRYDAEVELQKVLAVMQKYPKLKIDIRSHTDCRGSYAYNTWLSDKRAKSTRSYLIEKGIDADRLTAKGYGESQLINHCECEGEQEVYCTEAEHQLNRRSEFVVTSI